MKTIVSRRNLISMAGVGLSMAATRPVWAAVDNDRLASDMLARAHAAFSKHKDKLRHLDRMGVVDFSRPSAKPRLFIVDMKTGSATPYLVAHGRGSDPKHTGWVEKFSNQPGSYASSDGAYATADEYIGAHGRSMRLTGLEPNNSNAYARAIVVHSSWYVSPDMVRSHGKLGRSEGCFVVAEDKLGAVLTQIGPGRLLYADKI